MNPVTSSARMVILVACAFGAACIDFDGAPTRFCDKATPAQQREVCTTSAEGAIWVSVQYGSYTPACLRVSVSDVRGTVWEKDIPRSAFERLEAHELTTAVFRKPEWGRELLVSVASHDASAGELCSGNELERHRSPEPLTVVPGEVVDFYVTLLAQDNDQDEHAQRTTEVAGTDCDDAAADVHPGLPEVCTGTRDTDCDGAAGCADTECLGRQCDDLNPCTLNDQCQQGKSSTAECIGTSKVCQPPNFVCYTGESACNPTTGACVYTQQPPTQPCDDEDACTSGDQCGLDASCKGTSSVTCTSPPNTACYESAGICNGTTGACSYTPKASTVSCDDSIACTQNDRCNGSGSCAGDPLPACVPPDACHRSDRPGCPSNATCVESVDASKVNTPCTTATRSGVCRVDGVCSSFPYVPSNFDPDAIPATDRGMDFQINCGSPTDPIIFDSSTLGGSAPAGCTFPPIPPIELIGDYVVIPIRNFSIGAGNAFKLRGTRPVILAVYGNATLSGALLADADLDVPGAGGNREGCGTQQGGAGGFANGEGSGGGGGGFGAAGAAGGRNDSNTAGGSLGAAVASTLAPLLGGCPGGVGGGTNGGARGAGGGALQMAVAGTLRVENWVSVSGGGGRGGKGSSGNAGGGGGGGSGGGLLLEAFRLELASQTRLTANGGGGAEGGDSSGKEGSQGNDGFQFSKDPAPGGDAGGIGAPGGQGGAEAGGPGTPGNGVNNAGGGGGGGGMGVIRLRGFGSCAIDPSCTATDGIGCDLSPKVPPVCN